MSEIIFNKLVRDKIPDILNQSGKSFSMKLVDSEDYYKALKDKLVEEVGEFIQSDKVEELADIEEVLRAILDYKNIVYKDFEKIRIDKKRDRGGFKLKLFLESITE